MTKQGQGHQKRRGHGLNKDDYLEHHEREQNNPLKENDFVADLDHMREHLSDQLKIDEDRLNDMTEGQANFIFFKGHDFNNDDKLDGLELYQSILHGVQEFFDEVDDLNESSKVATITTMLNRLTMAVDRILEEDDKDFDGYLSYEEFANARLASDHLKDFNIKGNA